MEDEQRTLNPKPPTDAPPAPEIPPTPPAVSPVSAAVEPPPPALTSLPEQPAEIVVPAADADPAQPRALINCPCGKNKIEEGAKICPYCGELLANYAATRALTEEDTEEGVPRWGTARFQSRMNLVIRVKESDGVFTFDSGTITELLIGRKDPDTGESPPVDLSGHGAVEKGVSRKHAAIVRKEGGSLQIVDRGSPNGTFLNGQRLIAHQPRILRDGDEVRLGRLILQVQFEKVG